jgi:hypothetical protein
VGNDWTELEGDWSVDETTCGEEVDPEDILVAPATVGAKLITTAESTNEWQYLEVATCGSPAAASGVVIQILVNWKSDTEFYYVEIEENNVHIKNAAGTTLASLSDTPALDGSEGGWGNVTEWHVCLGKAGDLTVDPQTDGDDIAVHACVEPIVGGKKMGLGNGAAVSFEINKFLFEEHQDTYSNCKRCCCRRCNTNCLAPVLTVRVSAADGSCSINPGYDGVEFPIYAGGASTVSPFDGDCNVWTPWNAGPSEPCWKPGTDDFWFWLGADCNGGCNEFTLWLDVDQNSCQGKPDPINDDYGPPLECSCNPFYLKWYAVRWGWNASEGEPTGDCLPGPFGPVWIEVFEP